MAGLTSNIVTSKNRAKPSWPKPDMSLTPFFGMNADKTGYTFAPSFANTDHPRSSIMMNLTLTNGSLYYYDHNGTEITNGVWNGGMTVAEAAPNAEHWVGWFMDSTDNALYLATIDVGTSPDTVYLSKVDKAGTVTAIGSGAQLGSNSMDYSSFYMLRNETGPMYRTGGDGSGNFVIPFTAMAGGGYGSNADPHRGVKLTINASTGAFLSHTNFLGDNFGTTDQYNIYGAIGPTANNIYGGPFAGQSGYAQGQAWIGSIVNLSTGRSISRAIFEDQTATRMNGPSSIKAIRWRGLYVYTNYSDTYGNRYYAETDMHNYIDEMAVYLGIL